jgi:hypothetical protein
MAKKIIGYQLQDRVACEVPAGLWDFQVFEDPDDARRYLYTRVDERERGRFLIYIIREGDIENPSIINLNEI